MPIVNFEKYSEWGLKKLHRVASREEREEWYEGGEQLMSSWSFWEDENALFCLFVSEWKQNIVLIEKNFLQLPSTIESEAENQNAPNSEPKGSQEMKEDAETEKGKGPKNISTQEKVILPNMKTGGHSTEELLKILAGGKLSEVNK